MGSTGNLGGEEKSGFPIAFFAGLVVVSVIVIVVLVATHSAKPAKPGQPPPKLPFAADAQSYAGNIHFRNLQLSESSNMLNEKFTYLDAVISNDGPRPIEAIEILVEFHDPFNQVILRETHRVISDSSPPLGAGQQRDFQITFESVPAEWNQQYPTIRVTGLVLQ